MTRLALTLDELALTRHALGLPNKRKRSYRNRYVVGPGCDDHVLWMDMVEAGFARRYDGRPLTGGDDLFVLTRAGAALSLRAGESLCGEDFPDAVA
jgi:hypothetical protein